MTSVRYPLRLEVDGETFVVTRRSRGTYDYDWISGRNTGYGFSSASGVAVESGETLPGNDELPEDDTGDHIEAIREFLSDIDPATGYLADD